LKLFIIIYREGCGWDTDIGALPFLGVAFGIICSLVYMIVDNGRYTRLLKAQTEGMLPPESRLPLTIVGSIALPIGLFRCAWTNSPSIHWSVSVIASAPFGFGSVLVFIECMNYLFGTYTFMWHQFSQLEQCFEHSSVQLSHYLLHRCFITWAFTGPVQSRHF
jgi:hypothetical protein